MEEALRTLIVGNAGVSALVSTRIYWRLAPQHERASAWINLHRIGGQRDATMTGASGLVSSRVQVDCRASTYATAKTIARAVVAAVQSYSGTVGGIDFGGIFIDAERDDDLTPTGDTESIYQTSLDLIIWHQET